MPHIAGVRQKLARRPRPGFVLFERPAENGAHDSIIYGFHRTVQHLFTSCGTVARKSARPGNLAANVLCYGPACLESPLSFPPYPLTPRFGVFAHVSSPACFVPCFSFFRSRMCWPRIRRQANPVTPSWKAKLFGMRGFPAIPAGVAETHFFPLDRQVRAVPARRMARQDARRDELAAAARKRRPTLGPASRPR